MKESKDFAHRTNKRFHLLPVYNQIVLMYIVATDKKLTKHPQLAMIIQLGDQRITHSLI